jgi:hypothetical protein
MDNLIIEKANAVMPYINFNAETGICEIEGQSYITNTYAFYEPIYTWLEDFTKKTSKIDFNIKITYFNTSSSKCILEILRILRRFRDTKGNLNVTWHLNKQDEDLEDEVQYFSAATGVDISLHWIEGGGIA